MAQADKVVLPGVGAFGDAMAELQRRASGRADPRGGRLPASRFLGICLGLQLLFDVGYEGGRYEGLGILPGEVVRFELPHEYKVPHMGWNQLSFRRDCPLLAGLERGRALLLRAFLLRRAARPAVIAAETNYPEPFCSMVWREQPVRHPVPSRKEPARRSAHAQELRRIVVTAYSPMVTGPTAVHGSASAAAAEFALANQWYIARPRPSLTFGGRSTIDAVTLPSLPPSTRFGPALDGQNHAPRHVSGMRWREPTNRRARRWRQHRVAKSTGRSHGAQARCRRPPRHRAPSARAERSGRSRRRRRRSTGETVWVIDAHSLIHQVFHACRK